MKTAFSRRSIACAGLALGIFTIAGGHAWNLAAQARAAATAIQPAGVRYSEVKEAELKEWLTYLSSDEMQGRQVFTEGYGRATQYIAGLLKDFGVKPLGTSGSYFQPVKLKTYRTTINSSVTVESNGQTRTFKHGDHVTFATNAGSKQTLTFNGIEFMGHALASDVQGRDLKGKLVLTIPPRPPARGNPGTAATAAAAVPAGPAPARGTPAQIFTAGAQTIIGFIAAPALPTSAEQALVQAQAALTQATQALAQAQTALRGAGGNTPALLQALQTGGANVTPELLAALTGQPAPAGARGPQLPTFTTVQRVDSPGQVQFSGDETFYEALFAGSGTTFADIRARTDRGDAVPPMSLPAKVTVNIDNVYEVSNQQITHNVVGMIEGTDPALKDTYVLFGAHLDHVGYSQTGTARGGATDGCRRRSPAAQAAVVAAGKVVQRPARGAAPGGRGAAPTGPIDQRDVVSNGADDDGSGSVSLLAVAKAFATGPKPKRTAVFVWHAGEEAGLYGSRYNADYPIVPIDKIQVQLNMDMVGRDDCDDIEGDFTNTLFLVGADRISTDLHNLIIQQNATLKTPLNLDYELNDVNDPEGVYTRSDHYSYASKGIPIAFFTTGLHPDYHRITDTVDKITFPKMMRIAQLVYETGFSIANTDRILERDNKGPRTGFGSKAEVLTK
jgi:hypothetical protein